MRAPEPALMRLRPLPAGNGIHRVRLDGGRHAVLKRRADAPPDFFAAEVRGYAALRASASVLTPVVFACETDFLLIEDLGETRPSTAFWPAAAHALAQLHATHARDFGFAADGWCGDGAQDNTPDHDGHRFFAERRLLPQMHRAHAAGLLDRGDCARIERLCSRLDALVPQQPPGLVHGDLWTANLHCCADGTPALIDAGAVHHGWAEADLAMLILFGTPPPAFFSAYAQCAPLRADWRERAPLYNLYHLLNHLNLFGGGYLPRVRNALKRYE